MRDSIESCRRADKLVLLWRMFVDKFLAGCVDFFKLCENVFRYFIQFGEYSCYCINFLLYFMEKIGPGERVLKPTLEFTKT